MNVEDIHKQISEAHRKSQAEGDLEKLLDTTLQFARLYEEFPQYPQVVFSAATGFMNLGYNALARLIFSCIIDGGQRDVPEFWNNLGVSCRNMHILDEALDAFRNAIDLNPYESNYYSNFSTIYINEGNQEPGETLIKSAIALQPDNHRALWNYALLLLEQGKLATGFELYDSGLLSGDRLTKTYYKDAPLPQWGGDSGQSVIFYDEQGIGDRVLFANALRRALPMCKRAVIDCHPRLDGLYKRAFSHQVEAIYATAKEKDAQPWLESHERFDACIATGSLPKFMWKSVSDIDSTPYFTADPEKVEAVKAKLGEYPRPWIGFAWTGGTPKTHNIARSFKIGYLYHFMDINRAGTWISLEYPKGSGDQVRRSATERGLNIVHFDDWIHDNDYDWTAAVVSQLDLVISPCTSVVHLAGSLGAQAWVMVPKRRAWRYPPGEDMYWYSSVKQYHQEVNNKWDEVIERVRIDLMKWLVTRDYI